MNIKKINSYTVRLCFCILLMLSLCSCNRRGVDNDLDSSRDNMDTKSSERLNEKDSNNSVKSRIAADSESYGVLEPTVLENIRDMDYPGMSDGKIGTLFDNSFTNLRWYKEDASKLSVKDHKNSDYIGFEGDTTKNGISSHVRLVFRLDNGKTISLYESEIDGAPATDAQVLSLLIKEPTDIDSK